MNPDIIIDTGYTVVMILGVSTIIKFKFKFMTPTCKFTEVVGYVISQVVRPTVLKINHPNSVCGDRRR